MRKNMLFGGMFCALLLAASPALATITAVLEEPAEGSASGIVQIRGHARAADDATVTVRLRVNGETRTGDEGIIPCCSLRNDVTPDVPTGFSAQVNYGVFPAGPLIIGVEITAEGCEPVIIDRSVQVVKLGGEEFASDVDLSSATIEIDSDGDIVITGAEVNPTDNLTLSFNSSNQSFTVTGGDFSTSGNFIANLNPSQTNNPPSSGSTAMGQGFFMLNEDMTLMYRIVVPHDGLTSDPINLMDPDAGELGSLHIHNAPAGAPGGIEIFLQPPLPTLTDGAFIWEGTTAALTDDQKVALQYGHLYANLHTETNLAGEIRGQIVAAGGTPGCADPSRVFFVDANPPAPESFTAQPNQGCRLFAFGASGSQELCEKGWQYRAGDPEAGPVQCVFFADFPEEGMSACAACGQNLIEAGFCAANTCLP
jgi:hypothetical protein